MDTGWFSCEVLDLRPRSSDAEIGKAPRINKAKESPSILPEHLSYRAIQPGANLLQRLQGDVLLSNF